METLLPVHAVLPNKLRGVLPATASSSGMTLPSSGVKFSMPAFFSSSGTTAAATPAPSATNTEDPPTVSSIPAKFM